MVHEDSNQRTLDHLKVAKHRLQAFQVQEGAATGRSGRATGRQGAGCRDDGMMFWKCIQGPQKKR